MKNHVLCEWSFKLQNQLHPPVVSSQTFQQTGLRNFWQALGLDVSLQYVKLGHFCSPPAPSGHCRCLWHGLFAPCKDTTRFFFFPPHRLIFDILLSPFFNSTLVSKLINFKRKKEVGILTQCSDVILLNRHLWPVIFSSNQSSNFSIWLYWSF